MMMRSVARGGFKNGDRFGTFPAPVRGLNTRDAITAMKPGYAVVLDNYFPESTFVKLRRGGSSWATGFTGDVETLMEWNGPSSRKFFAANGTAIYDITSSGAIGAGAVTGLTNVRFSFVQFTTTGGDFLVLCNGADAVRNYDGTSWTSPSITNVSGDTLNYVASFKRRLWFVEENSTRAWYLPADAIAGAAAKLDLGAVFRDGGHLKMIGSFSMDAGDGPDDFIAFFSANGEIAVYQGTDPSSATTFALVGTFHAGDAVGERSLLKVGGDLALISYDGIVSVQTMLKIDRSAANKAAVTNAIDRAFADAARLYGSSWGWQAITYPRGHYALVNVPRSATVSWQYVMNTQTGAWCRFLGQPARCWGLFGEDLYYGMAGKVVKADTGTDDLGAAIDGDILPAFQDFGGGSLLKQFKMARPLYRANAVPTIAIVFNVDYAQVRPQVTDAPQGGSAGDAVWGTMVWGSFIWSGITTVREWRAATGLGFTASPWIRTQSDGYSIEIDAIDVVFETAQRMAVA